MNPTFNPTNSEHLLYHHGIIEIAILGGIRLEGLDRLRVTLKIKAEHQSVRHNLDLYNSLQVDKLIKKTAERLEIGTSVVLEVMTDLTDQLETYRLESLEQQNQVQDKRKMLTPEEIKAAKKYATAPKLMQRTGDDLQAMGIIGEYINALALTIVMTSRKCKDPISAITLAKSGMGKTYLQEKVATIIPQEDIIESTQITESSFYRFGRHELSGKLFLIEDLDGAESSMYPIREMQTKKRISKTVTIKDKQGTMKTVTLVVEGPVSVCGCTTKEAVYEDNANRSLLLHLDSSKEQDKAIMDYHRKAKAGKIDKYKEEQIREQLENVQRILLPVTIINPHAELIDLPSTVPNQRRTLTILLSFIESVTFYHQYQRNKLYDKETGEEYMETTLEDIEWAFELLKPVLFRKSDELSGACRKFYDWIGSSDRGFSREGFYAKEIREINNIHPRTLRRYLEELRLFGRLEIVGGEKHKTGYLYAFTDWKADLNIKETINEWMDNTLNTIQKALVETEKEHKKSA
jgi:hypothetical protein